MVYIATYNSGAAKVSMPITNKAGMAQVTVANTYPGLTKPGNAPGEPGIYRPTGKVNYFRPFRPMISRALPPLNWRNAWGSNGSLSSTIASSTAKVSLMSSKRQPRVKASRSWGMRGGIGRYRFPRAVDQGQGCQCRPGLWGFVIDSGGPKSSSR